MQKITIIIGDEPQKMTHANAKEKKPELPWALKMGQSICPGESDFRFLD